MSNIRQWHFSAATYSQKQFSQWWSWIEIFDWSYYTDQGAAGYHKFAEDQHIFTMSNRGMNYTPASIRQLVI
jgi:hypothetical protein